MPSRHEIVSLSRSLRSSRIRAFGHLVEPFFANFVIIHHGIITSTTFFERRLVLFEVGSMFPSDVASR